MIEKTLFSKRNIFLTLTSTVDLSCWLLIVRDENLRVTKSSFFSGFLKNLRTKIDAYRLFLSKSFADSSCVTWFNLIGIGKSLLH